MDKDYSRKLQHLIVYFILLFVAVTRWGKQIKKTELIRLHHPRSVLFLTLKEYQ